MFLVTLAIALAVSLSWTFLRPPEYRTAARVEITPAVKPAPVNPQQGTTVESASPFLTEVQVITSRPVLEAVLERLQKSGLDLSEFGQDPISGVQSRFEVFPVANTNVVELVATGPKSELLAPLLNAIIDVYRERLAESYRSASTESLEQINSEVSKLAAGVAAKRRDLEAFRVRNNIVSLEREENQVLSRLRGLGTSLNTANEKVAIAEGKLRALEDSAAAGKAVVRSRDNPTLANLEQRASQLREDMREMERSYTGEYLAKDPRAKSLRTRIAELDRQIGTQRAGSQQAVIAEAEDEVASAQSTQRRIQASISAQRQEVAQFTARFNEYKSRQEEFSQIEALHRDAVARRARLETSERARMPKTRVVESALPPRGHGVPSIGATRH